MPENDNSSAGSGGDKTSFGVPRPASSGGMNIVGGIQPITSGAGKPAGNPGFGHKGVGVPPTPTGQQHYPKDPTAPARNVLRQLTGRGADPSWGAQAGATTDMFGSLVGYVTGYQDDGKVVLGIVKDGTAIANTYFVKVTGGVNPIPATALSHSTAAALGATEINTYVPGTCVAVLLQDRGSYGFILGAIPNALFRGKDAFQDNISQASRNRVDDCHKKHLKSPKSSEITDCSNWRPYDSTLAGEWGAMSSTGIRVFVDDFMMQAAVNEFCGIYGFYHDNLLRVAGYNMQVWTAGSERESFMDQAECNDIQGYTPYPWEGMGVLRVGQPVIEEYEPGCYQCFEQKPYYSHWENKHEFAQPYHRSQVFFGYLGQGMRQVVHAPPEGQDRWTYKGEKGDSGEKPYDSKIESGRGLQYNCKGGPSKDTDHQEKPVYGLSEENKALDGRLFIASAKGVHISKRILLPFPQRIRRPEDVKQGDDAEKNYKAASKFGSGQEHDITGTIKTTDEQYPNLQRAAALLDLHGYLYNYAGLHPFYWHAKDYKTWEQQDLEYADSNQKIPKFSVLQGSQMYLKEEQPKIFKIDHRYDKKEQKFYETESFISLLDDGGIVIGDGYGGEIRMTGGCVIISAPGDVWLKGGRDVQAWAGNDVILRANKSAEISSTEKNVRIKAERNVLVLAGNDSSDREGGILLESRGKTIEYDFEKCGDDVKFAGVVLRAPKSNVVSLAKEIYLRTGGGEIEQGDITIDSSKGDKDIITKSNNLHSFLKQSGTVYHYFGGQKVGGATKANMFSEQLTLLCSATSVGGSLFVRGVSLFENSLLVKKGHIFTEQANRGKNCCGVKKLEYVLPCDGGCQAAVQKALDEFKRLAEKEIPDIGNQIDEMLKTKWYEEKRAGNDRVMTIMEFSFRNDDQYKIPDFLLYEDRWQQMARLGGEIPDQWTERGVKAKVCDKTYPFPGKKWLESSPAYKEQDFKIVQTQDGYVDKERGEAPGLASEYKEPEFKQPNAKVINGNYIITPRK